VLLIFLAAAKSGKDCGLIKYVDAAGTVASRLGQFAFFSNNLYWWASMRLFRFYWFLIVAVLTISHCGIWALAAAPEVEPISVAPAKADRPISLRDRLVVGLQARLKSEVAFVDVVVQRVQSGQLPQRQVDETFFWARQRAAILRNGRTRRPIIYFEPAMRARADRLHIQL
jgi:hypothetical protein